MRRIKSKEKDSAISWDSTTRSTWGTVVKKSIHPDIADQSHAPTFRNKENHNLLEDNSREKDYPYWVDYLSSRITTQHWTSQELNIFYICCKKYGCYDISSILKNRHLVHKNKQQIWDKSRQIFGSHFTYKYAARKKIDVQKFLKYMKYNPQLTLKRGKKTQNFLLEKFRIPEKEVKNLKIPFYREIDNEYQKWSFIIETKSLELSPDVISRSKLKSLRDQLLKEEDLRIKNEINEKRELEPYVEYVFRFMKQQPRLTTDYHLLDIPENDYLTLIEGLSEEEVGITVEFFVLQTYSKPQRYGYASKMKSRPWLNYQEIMLQALRPDLAVENQSFKNYKGQLSTVLPEGKEFCNWNPAVTRSRLFKLTQATRDSQQTLIFLEYKQNHFVILNPQKENSRIKVFIQPPFSTVVEHDLRIPMDNHTGRLSVDVILVDPPWTKLKVNEILNKGLAGLQDQGILMIWIKNEYLMDILRWMKQNDYDTIEEIIWVRDNYPGGNCLKDYTTTCLVGIKGSRIDIKFPKHKAGSISSVVKVRSTQKDKKPDEVYAMVEEMIPNGEKVELYGTSHNLRNYWTTIGIDINPIHEWRKMADGYYHSAVPPIFDATDNHAE